MTILRLLFRISFAAATVTNVVNCLTAFYVGTRGSQGTPPDLNADIANYYYFGGAQLAASPAGTVGNTGFIEKDIRTARIIRGEDTELFFRISNNEVTGMQFGVETRMLLKQR